MARVTSAQVRKLIDSSDDFDVDPFIETATELTDYVSGQDSGGVLTANMLVQIEKWLAAHFYAICDPQPQQEKTGGATAVVQGKTGFGLDLTHWGQQAKMLDHSGTLAELDKGRVPATVSWLGLAPSDQTDYVDRD